tara:strand:- start:716 stop:1150 length:435 start_codon:yes stop_codon:yes gene_type:complete
MKYQVMNEKQVRVITENFVTAVEKGYPEIVAPLTYFVRVNQEEVLGYTSYRDMGDFYFVGNTFIDPKARGQGVYSELLSHRNRCLPEKPKVTLVNPINGTNPEILFAQVKKQGGSQVNSYQEVRDIMPKEIYERLNTLPIFIYR